MNGHIHILPPEEAKKIAAGEVIDRPAALVREFIDNAIDSGADTIELSIESGGIRKVEVIDNGRGMTKDDLALCLKTHATSKIRSLDDLLQSRTLGFRGEALAAAAAAADLEILSAVEPGEAWLLTSRAGGSDGYGLSPGRRVRGTSVRSYGLFDAIPARKRFLKREGSEALLCRNIFTEKALAFPGLAFRFIQDGRLKLYLPAYPDANACSYKDRFGELILSSNERCFLHELYAAGNGFSLAVVFGGPELFRHDRRQQYVFANNRRIQDYSLIQALEYGLAGFFPNGTHPLGAVFIDIDPALADFNIHPAKREARFTDPGAIHHALTNTLRNYVRSVAKHSAVQSADAPVFTFGGRAAMEALLARRDEFVPLRAGGETAAEAEPVYRAAFQDAAAVSRGPALRLAGRAFGLFIIVEKGDKLFLVDQHAAHERVLYNRFLSNKIAVQELLVAISFAAESEEEDAFLRTKKEELARYGIVLEYEDGDWRIEALPAGWKLGDSETVEAVLSLRTAGENMAERWAATAACKAAVKDGDFLDDGSALELAMEALSLPEGRCPHGRPIWLEISRNDLFKAVRRIE